MGRPVSSTKARGVLRPCIHTMNIRQLCLADPTREGYSGGRNLEHCGSALAQARCHSERWRPVANACGPKQRQGCFACFSVVSSMWKCDALRRGQLEFWKAWVYEVKGKLLGGITSSTYFADSLFLEFRPGLLERPDVYIQDLSEGTPVTEVYLRCSRGRRPCLCLPSRMPSQSCLFFSRDNSQIFTACRSLIRM